MREAGSRFFSFFFIFIMAPSTIAAFRKKTQDSQQTLDCLQMKRCGGVEKGLTFGVSGTDDAY